MPLHFQSKLLCSGTSHLDACLDKQEEFAMLWEDSDYVKAVTSRMINEQSGSLTDRLIAIIGVQKPALTTITESAACVVLLPEMEDPKNAALVIQALKQVFAPMRGDSPVLIYPYGHAAFLMALRKIESLAKNDPMQGVWVVGLDTALAFCQRDNCIEQPIACVDSLFVIKVTAQSCGLDPIWTQMDAAVGGKTQQECLRFLFRASVQSVPNAYESVWLPVNRTDLVKNDWIHEFHFLHNKVNEATQHHFMEFQVGDLGVNLALFKTLTIMNLLSKPDSTVRYCLQVDVANKTHLSAAIFNWCD